METSWESLVVAVFVALFMLLLAREPETKYMVRGPTPYATLAAH
jgi:hypothetical protein